MGFNKSYISDKRKTIMKQDERIIGNNWQYQNIYIIISL